ncbi:Rz1-like lysis system protein LysC [Serratia fonticola]|uniref:Rz1-like lysis system protein LysC n=1 Tax=Serratia fonticola TaxID=47917 RepID=UPI003AAEBA4E
MPHVKPYAKHRITIGVLGSLCLMMLYGCSIKPSTPISCSVEIIPQYLLASCPLPKFDVKKWGDYPDYVARLHLAINRCNTDKEAIMSILHSYNRSTD